jgi:hypothetical protein
MTVVGATSAICGFVMIFQGSFSASVPNKAPYGTLHKARNADFMGSTAISGAAAEPFGIDELAGIFQVGQPTPPQGWPAKGGNAQWRTATHRRDFF